MAIMNGNRRNPCVDGIVLYPDCINADIPIVILLYSFARCYRWENSLCIISYNYMGIYTYLKIKSSWKK